VIPAIPWIRTWFAITIGIAASSCGVRESGGDAPASPTLVEDGRIADNGGGPAYEFTSIEQVLERGDSVFIRQRGVQEIRVFSSEGQHLATYGRAGSGPGEFQSLEAMGFLGDTLWTIDGDLRRLSFFTSGGALLTTQQYEPVSPSLGGGSVFFFPYFKALLNDGRVLGFGWAGRDIASGRVTATPQLLMTRAGRTLDTLAWVPIGHEHMIIQSDRATMYMGQPYGDAAITVYSSEGNRLYVVDGPAAQASATAQVTVTAINVDGDTAWVTAMPYEPVRLEEHEVDSVRNAYRKAHATRFTTEQVDKAFYVPAFRPPLSDAVAAVDGALWIRWDDRTRSGGVTVIDASGRVRQHLTVESRAKVVWASADHMWLERKDENDVPSLVRYRFSSNSHR